MISIMIIMMIIMIIMMIVMMILMNNCDNDVLPCRIKDNAQLYLNICFGTVIKTLSG